MPGISSKEETQIAVLSAVAADPAQSVRDISRDSGLSRHTVHTALKKNKFRPYHLHLHQALSESDYEKRLRFCHWAQQVMADNEHFFSRVLWTDEATFCNDGTINRHNMHRWSDTNPHFLREVDKQHRWKVNVWCGIIGDKIVGPQIFDGTVNAAYFAEFLDTTLPGLLEDLPLETRQTMWMQLDGCPVHSSRIVKEKLSAMFPGRCIGRGMDIEWPPRSPDLTPLDYYLWGRVKDLAYKDKPANRGEMILKILESIRSLNGHEILKAVGDFRGRILSCVNAEGGHFENLF